jgi:hypothetical protein
MSASSHSAKTPRLDRAIPGVLRRRAFGAVASLLLGGCGARDGLLELDRTTRAPTQVQIGATQPPRVSSALQGATPQPATAVVTPLTPTQSVEPPARTESTPVAPPPAASVSSAFAPNDGVDPGDPRDELFVPSAKSLLAVYGWQEHVWAVGLGGTLLSWQALDVPLDEIPFEAHTLPERPTLRGVWAAAADDVWAVGDAATIAHWDGTAWEVRPIEGQADLGGARLNAIWGADSSDIWAVGEQGLLLHFDGSGWVVVPSNLTENLLRVIGTSASDVLIGGCDAVLHYDGVAWQSQPASRSGGGDCWQEAFARNGDELWLTGYWWASGFKGGGGGPLMSYWVTGELTGSLKNRAREVAWGLPDGRIVAVTTTRTVSGRDSFSEVSVYSVQEDEAGDAVVPFLKTPVPINDLWGTNPWLWAVGDNGFVKRIAPTN